MNVLIVINRLLDVETAEVTIGGIQTYLVNLAKLIHDNFGVKPTIVQFYKDDVTFEFEDYSVVGYRTRRRAPLSLFRRILQDYSQSDTLIIWGSDQYSVKQDKFNSINIQHGIGFDTVDKESVFKKYVISHGFGFAYKFLQRFKARRLSLNGDITVCVDYNFKNWISTYVYDERERFVVIPNFSKKDVDKSCFKNRECAVVVARRFVKRRGIGLAVSVAEKILNENPEIKFCFAGSGPEEYLIQELVKRYPGRVVITQFKADDSISFHSKFKYALVPSIGSEGTSFSLLEAMASGCCVIATDVGGMTNIILDHFNGRMVPPSENELSLALSEVIHDDEKASILAGRGSETVEYSFSKKNWENKWKSIIAKYIV